MMMESEKFYDALEGCRPGQLDADGPEYQAVREQLLEDGVLLAQFEKSQVLDQQLTELFADVPVSEELRNRLQKAIDEAVIRGDLDIDAVMQAEVPTGDHPVESLVIERDEQRGFGPVLRWLAVAASLLIAVAVWRQFQQVDPISAESLVGQAADWTERVMSQEHTWYANVKQLPTDYPVDSYVLPPVQKWSRVKTSIDARAVVYDLSSAKTDRLLLFVVHSRQAYQLPQVALQELMGTGSLTVGAWQQGNLLYVMVGRRNGPALQRFIRQRLLGYRLRPILPVT